MKVHTRLIKAFSALLIAALLFAALPAGETVAQTTTITVCPVGETCDYHTIQGAINAASSGDIIEVWDGTYDFTSEGEPVPAGLIKINKPITIKAAVDGNETRPIIDSTGFDGAIKMWHSTFTGGQVLIEGFEITGDGATDIAITAAMQYAVDSTEIIIRDNVIHGMNSGIDFWGTSGGSLTKIEITDNVFYDLGQDGAWGFGVMLEDPSDWSKSGDQFAAVVEGNTFYNIYDSSSEDGVGVVIPRANEDNGEASNVRIANNTFEGTVSVGVALIDGDISEVEIVTNDFGALGVYVDDANTTSGPADASPNWWGSPCGPAAGAFIGDVEYSPWYVDEAMTQTSDGTSYIFPAAASIESMNTIIACAAPGSTLTFESGAFPGGLVVDNNGLTFDLNGVTVGPGSPAFTVNGDNFTINGPGTLDGGGSSDHAIVVADGVSNFTLNNAEILNWANGVHYAGEIINTQIVDNFIHDLTGDGVHFTQQPTAQTSVSFYIQGNLFKHNGGVGVNNAGATEINAEYNSWSDYTGPTGPDGDGSTNADTDPFTHVDLYMVSTNPDVDNWPNQVFVDDTITYQVKAHVVNLTTAAFEFSYPTDLLGSPTIANVNTNFSPVPTYTDVVTVNETTGVISFDGQTGTTTTLTPLSGDVVLFEVTFTGLLPGEATLDFEETSDLFGMSPGYGPSLNIYADELVNSELKVITRPTMIATGIEGPYVAGLSHEISMETCNAATGGDWSESVDSPIEPDTIGWIRISDITLDKIASLQFLWGGDWYDFSVQDAYGGHAVQQDGDDVIARFGNYNFGLEILNDWCDVDGFRVTFVEPGTHDVTVEIYDMMDTDQDDIGGDDILLASLGPITITVQGNFDVTGTISMQGRTVRTGVPLTLTDVDGDPIYGPHNTTSTSELAYNVLFTGVNGSIYEITTNQPRYLNITEGLDKQFLVDSAYTISALELKGGNANWDIDNIVDISDASIVGTQYGTGDINDDGDVNFDNRVNIQDLAIVGGNYLLDGATAYALWLIP